MEKELKIKVITDKQSKINAKDIENCNDYNDLIKLKEIIAANLNTVRTQIEAAGGKAAADGKYADPDWWARANGYKRFLGFLHQKCQFRERELKHERIKSEEEKLKENKPKKNDKDRINELFVELSKEVLGESKFFSLLSLAHEKLELEKMVAGDNGT